MQLQIDDKVAEGIYVNSANVMFNKGEFVIDFIRITPPPGKPKVMSRVIMSPFQMKAFLKALLILGVFEKGRMKYWKMLFYSLIKFPEKFPLTVRLSIFGYHFRRVARKLA